MKAIITSPILDETMLTEVQKEVDRMNEESRSVFEIFCYLSENYNCTGSITFEKGVAFINIK